MVKRISILCSILLGISFLMSCTSASYKSEINANGKAWMDNFVKKDADGIYDAFSKDVKENRSELTKEEIREALDFIDGNIIESEYEGYGGGAQSKENYKTIFYYSDVEFNLFTDNDKNYHICITYIHIWDEHPELIGINCIRISEYDNEDKYYYENDNEMIIGDIDSLKDLL